jgi:acid phosphatase
VIGGLVVTGRPPVVAASGTASAPHVMVVMMENKNFSEVIGKSDQPFTNSLADHYGLATQSYAFGHPSLPNYLTIISGSNQGVTDDNDPSSHSFPGVKTIADQLSAAGFTARAYAEDLPGNPATSSGEYAVRHVPWEYFPGTAITLKDASTMVADLNGASPPDFVWYTPNLINDEHDGTVQDGDAFLSSFIPKVQGTAWYRQGGQVIIEWDESDNDNSGINGGDGGHIPTIVVSAVNADSPIQDSARVDTAGILRSIEDRYGLAHLANAANSANGTIDALLATSSTAQARSFATAAGATTTAGAQFSFLVRTTGTPTPRLKKHGRLPRGLHFHNNHNGTADISGTLSTHDSPGTYQVTLLATYGKGRAKQTVSQLFSVSLSG